VRATESALHQQVHGIYVDHHGWLTAWLRKTVGSADHAADLAHDTFLRLLSRGEPVALTEPRAYLVTVARGLVIDFRRRHALERAYMDVLASLPAPQHPSPEARSLVLEALVAIDHMLDGMKPPVRQAFLLSQLDGLTYAQIAAELKVSVRTVNTYMLKAIEHCYLLMP
jgi:RNA polymerase sigma-70 factor (ECF subfamily)